MPDNHRDDTNLFSLVCPHCEETVPVCRVDHGLIKPQLLFMRCPNCDKGITKSEIDATWKDYVASHGKPGR